MNGTVLIKEVIKVKTYVNMHGIDKQADVYLHCLPDDVTTSDLEQSFSVYGNILSVDIKQDKHGKNLGYGYVQFAKKEDAEKFL
jgi:polyadenylate-binding protein